MAGRVIEHVGQIGATRSGAAVVVVRVAVLRGVAVRVARAGRAAGARVATTGSLTSKPRLRRTADAASTATSSAIARRPVAYRCATPTIARG